MELQCEILKWFNEYIGINSAYLGATTFRPAM